MQPNQLPIYVVVNGPHKVGHDGKEMFFICLAGLVLCALTGYDPGRFGFVIVGGGCLVGLALWTSKTAFYRGKKIELWVDAEAITFSRDLLKHPQLWSQFRNGKYIQIPWSEILRWDFTDPDHHARVRGWYPTQYSLRLRSTPGTYLVMDREVLMDKEDQFIPWVEHILKSIGHEFYGLEDSITYPL